MRNISCSVAMPDLAVARRILSGIKQQSLKPLSDIKSMCVIDRHKKSIKNKKSQRTVFSQSSGKIRMYTDHVEGTFEKDEDL